MVSVFISYRCENRIDFQILAEFLRLTGIYVQENTVEDVFTQNMHAGSMFYAIEDQDTQVGRSADKNRQNQVLADFQNEYNAQFSEGREFSSVYEVLSQIFLKHDLFTAGITLQYFRMKEQIVEEAGDKFAQAAKALKEKQEENEVLRNNPYVEYARIFCWQKANLVSYLCEKKIAYFINDLAEECLNLIQGFPDFSNAWVLLAFIYEFLEDKVDKSLDAFEQALEVINKEPYASSVYYWAGRRCEGYRTLTEKMDVFYNNSYNLVHKYRAAYKIAMKYEEKKDWNSAIKYFGECLKCIERRGTFLDPLEQEYSFKVNVRISYIFIYKLNDYYSGIDYAGRALKIRDEILAGGNELNENTRFYWEAFGDNNAKKFIQVSSKRMRINQVCEYLSKAYERLGMHEESLRYWETAKKD